MGITSLERDDGGLESFFDGIHQDRPTTILALLSVVIVTTHLLSTQLVTLNKSYLAIMGYISGEWKLVDDPSSVKKYGASAPSPWDPRRRYKKGDLISHNVPGFRRNSIYMATSNSPEGRPFDLFLRASHDLFRHELGHPTTSRVIAAACRTQLLFVWMLTVVVAYYRVAGYALSALLSILFANIIAFYGLMHVGLLDHSELKAVAKEIEIH